MPGSSGQGPLLAGFSHTIGDGFSQKFWDATLNQTQAKALSRRHKSVLDVCRSHP
jgi:hypothetical protein